MTTILLAFVFMLVLVAAMAIGVLFGRKPIAGSCGGMKALGMNMECEICGGDPNQCESGSADRIGKTGQESPARALAHDVGQRSRR